jgi:hypothetical protein
MKGVDTGIGNREDHPSPDELLGVNDCNRTARLVPTVDLGLL